MALSLEIALRSLSVALVVGPPTAHLVYIADLHRLEVSMQSAPDHFKVQRISKPNSVTKQSTLIFFPPSSLRSHWARSRAPNTIKSTRSQFRGTLSLSLFCSER
jgi:hypothetical protein